MFCSWFVAYGDAQRLEGVARRFCIEGLLSLLSPWVGTCRALPGRRVRRNGLLETLLAGSQRRVEVLLERLCLLAVN